MTEQSGNNVALPLSDPDAIDDQRVRLLAGLAESIREKGLAKTQLGDIVRHARASKRTFYKHFPDKDACFVELARLLSAQVRKMVFGAIDPEADWDEQLDQAIDMYVGLCASDPPMVEAFASAALSDSIVRAQREAMESYAQAVVDMTSTPAFVAAGIQDVPIERAYMLISGLHNTLMRAVVNGEEILPLADEFKYVFRAVAVANMRDAAPQPR